MMLIEGVLENIVEEYKVKSSAYEWIVYGYEYELDVMEKTTSQRKV